MDYWQKARIHYRIIFKIHFYITQVESLVNQQYPAGSNEVEFNAISLPSGIYLYIIQADDYLDTKKMILMK